jgi:hypothetical protein
MAELVDATDLKSVAVWRAGSTPADRTIGDIYLNNVIFFGMLLIIILLIGVIAMHSRHLTRTLQKLMIARDLINDAGLNLEFNRRVEKFDEETK